MERDREGGGRERQRQRQMLVDTYIENASRQADRQTDTGKQADT